MNKFCKVIIGFLISILTVLGFAGTSFAATGGAADPYPYNPDEIQRWNPSTLETAIYLPSTGLQFDIPHGRSLATAYASCDGTAFLSYMLLGRYPDYDGYRFQEKACRELGIDVVLRGFFDSPEFASVRNLVKSEDYVARIMLNSYDWGYISLTQGSKWYLQDPTFQGMVEDLANGMSRFDLFSAYVKFEQKIPHRRWFFDRYVDFRQRGLDPLHLVLVGFYIADGSRCDANHLNCVAPPNDPYFGGK